MSTLHQPIATGRFSLGTFPTEQYNAAHGQSLSSEAIDTSGISGQPMLISSLGQGPTGPGATYEWAEPAVDGNWHKVLGSSPTQYVVRPGG